MEFSEQSLPEVNCRNPPMPQVLQNTLCCLLRTPPLCHLQSRNFLPTPPLCCRLFNLKVFDKLQLGQLQAKSSGAKFDNIKGTTDLQFALNFLIILSSMKVQRTYNLHSTFLSGSRMDFPLKKESTAVKFLAAPKP